MLLASSKIYWVRFIPLLIEPNLFYLYILKMAHHINTWCALSLIEAQSPGLFPHVWKYNSDKDTVIFMVQRRIDKYDRWKWRLLSFESTGRSSTQVQTISYLSWQEVLKGRASIGVIEVRNALLKKNWCFQRWKWNGFSLILPYFLCVFSPTVKTRQNPKRIWI